MSADNRTKGQKIRASKLGKFSARLAPSKHPTLDNIYWAAGLCEGEGNCIRTDPYVRVLKGGYSN